MKNTPQALIILTFGGARIPTKFRDITGLFATIINGRK